MKASFGFRGLFENATIGIYRTSYDGKILLANPTLLKIFRLRFIGGYLKKFPQNKPMLILNHVIFSKRNNPAWKYFRF